MDTLASTGYLNYFGKVPNFETLSFSPVLLKKDDNYVAVYGIGSMNDDRLFRLFEEEKVFILKFCFRVSLNTAFFFLLQHTGRISSARRG